MKKMDGGVGHTAWVPEGREGQSQAGPKGQKPALRAANYIHFVNHGYDMTTAKGLYLKYLPTLVMSRGPSRGIPEGFQRDRP